MFSSKHVLSKVEFCITQLRSYPFLHEKENAELCANILETICNQSEIYSLLCRGSHYYSSHFLTLLEKDTLDEDDILSLLEDSIMLVREKTLKSGICHATYYEKKAIQYVTDGTLWSEYDGTLFSESFFHQLPLAVVQSIFKEAATHYTLTP